MKRPKFLTIWLILLLLFAIVLTVDSLTYLPFISLTKDYVSLLGIIAGFVQIYAVTQLLKWKKIGATLLVFSAIVIMLVTAINEFYLVFKINQIITSMAMVLLVNLIMFGVLYLAIKPVWRNFK